jgi:hypothetical protein
MKITICGSAKFEQHFVEWNEKLTLAGHIVYSLAIMPSSKGGNKDWYTEDQKELLDLAHLGKIEESDAIVVLNVEGYYGTSTNREINWARLRGKHVYWLEPQGFKGSTLNADSLI